MTMQNNLQTPQLHVPGLAGQQQQNAFPAEVANFNLLVAENRTSDRAPHYFGSFKLNGQWYQVSTWIQYAKNSGKQMLSNSVRPCTPEEAARHEARDQAFQAQRGQGQPLGQPAPTASPAVNPLHPNAPVANPDPTMGIPPETDDGAPF